MSSFVKVFFYEKPRKNLNKCLEDFLKNFLEEFQKRVPEKISDKNLEGISEALNAKKI